MKNHVRKAGGNTGVAVTKKDFMKKLRFIMVCTLMILMTVVLIAGCKTKNSDDFASGEHPDVATKDKPNFTGEMQIPLTMTIEKIDLKDVKIIPVGVDDKGYMLTPPEADGVTWFDSYASPGWDCNAIFSGHNYYDGVAGTFARLHELVEGDEVIFKYEDGSVGHFKVYFKEKYPEDAVPESTMLNEGQTRTTLITCDGERKSGGGYPFRIVFHLEAVERVDKDGNKMIIEVDTETESETPEE
ncbi:MAG: class F sortase [Peptococcaceae bacterium]|nr:class F sortase [Peptococcaceae bacterium]